MTLEPCAMCAGAILQARIDTVVWGAQTNLLEPMAAGLGMLYQHEILYQSIFVA